MSNWESLLVTVGAITLIVMASLVIVLAIEGATCH